MPGTRKGIPAPQTGFQYIIRMLRMYSVVAIPCGRQGRGLVLLFLLIKNLG